MLKIGYRESDVKALITWDINDEGAFWLDALKRLLFDNCEDTRQENNQLISLPWWVFSSLSKQLNQLFQGFGFALGIDVEIEKTAEDLLRQSRCYIQSYEQAVAQKHVLSEAELLKKLEKVGFSLSKRPLTPEQKRNVCRIAALPASATFSVPGAGKTTEALAIFFYRATPDERLLVVAPKNAFAAWDEQLQACMPYLNQQFKRLRGSEQIAQLLEKDPRFMLITYQQLSLVRNIITRHLSRFKTHVFLDESHRIKNSESQSTRIILNVSELPVSKLIMSGTPMPQAIDDLLPQFQFLYPEIRADVANVKELMKPIYVRTTKNELGLPNVERNKKKVPMAPVQYELYKLMKFEVAREAQKFSLGRQSKQIFRSLGRSVVRLLQFVSNPALLSREIGFAHTELLQAVLAEGDSPKIRYVLQRARELANTGHKVLIWSSFVQNVEYIASRLSDLGAVFIHGNVDTGDEDDDESREGKIKLFHSDKNVKVLVANPAAASEGISLHTVCHHAIYLDRTFNAAHYLQSEDRIHRIGLAPDQITNIEIVECSNSIDETVHERLRLKVKKMAQVLGDSGLCIDTEPVVEEQEDYVIGLNAADVEALAHDLLKDKDAN